METKYNNWISNLGPTRREEIIKKVIKKYSSQEYRDKEYKLGREPEEVLYFVLLDWAEEFCPRCFVSVNPWFPEYQYDIDGKYIISSIYGQGVLIRLTKIKVNVQTVAILEDPEVMQNAAVRLLGL